MVFNIEHSYDQIRSEAMEAPYQVFRIDADGSRTFCDDAPTYAFAEGMAQKYACLKPGRYAIVHLSTGQATVLNFDDAPSRTTNTSPR